MAQHFLLSTQARKLNPIKLAMMSDEAAHKLFADIRWSSNNGNPICPICGNVGKCYARPSRKQFRCKECNYVFSVTSGTIFSNHKLPLKVYLIAIALFTNAVKSISALQLSRDLDCQYKTAFVLAHKIRESLMEHKDDSEIEGVVEMDGVYVNHYIRPKNNINDRVDRRKIYKPDKRVVISMRQRADEAMLLDSYPLMLKGAIKTKAFVLKSENSRDLLKLARQYIKRGSVVHTDEAVGYDDMHGLFEMKRVNHQEEYSSIDGACNNQSESYNARFRRMQYGQLHKIGNLYLSNYANEIAYREDTRRWDNGMIFEDITHKCGSTPVSNEWCGYWQGNKRCTERLGA